MTAHHTPAPAVPAEAAALLEFWRAAGREGLWFRKDAAFDRRFAERFAAAHEAAASGALDDWAATPEGALARVILLDQYPRNAFRGSPRSWATDALARAASARALEDGFFERVEPALRLFFALPFSHSEHLPDQDRAVALNRALGAESMKHAEEHRDVVQRFGRFPHRNAVLGRTTTPEEQAFLDAGGFSG